MTIEEFLNTEDPDYDDCANACMDYINKHPIFNGENFINLVGLDVTGLLFFTYSKKDKLEKIKIINKKPKGNRMMLIGYFLYSLYAISKLPAPEYKKFVVSFKSHIIK